MHIIRTPEVRRSLRMLVILAACATVFGHRWPWLAVGVVTIGAASVAWNVIDAIRDQREEA